MDDQGKYPILQEAAKRATEKQPDEIHLIATPQHVWSNTGTIDNYTTSLLALGFAEAGIYTVDVLPVAIRFFLKERERMYSTVYEHPKTGVWINVVVLHEDGTSMTFTNTRDRGIEKRPGHPIVYAPGATPDQLYSIALQKSPPNTRKQLSAASLVEEFERAWAEGTRWRRNRGGISITEAASVVLSRGGQPTRLLRPERVQYLAEQNGVPEREFKTALKTLLDRHGSVEKAYLVYVKYDEEPEGSVALCVVSASRDFPVENIRKIFGSRFKPGVYLDILVVLPSEVPRIERVCAPFYTRTVIHNWMRMLLAVLLGNLIYFAAEGAFPAALKHNRYKVDPGLVLDFAICVGIYLLLRKREAKK